MSQVEWKGPVEVASVFCQLYACVLAQAWLPQYQQLAEDSSEKAVAGVQIFGWVNNMVVIGINRGLHDARAFDVFGGFAEFQRVWRRYDARSNCCCLRMFCGVIAICLLL